MKTLYERFKIDEIDGYEDIKKKYPSAVADIEKELKINYTCSSITYGTACDICLYFKLNGNDVHNVREFFN